MYISKLKRLALLASPHFVARRLEAKQLARAELNARVAFYREWLSHGDVVFDIGANVGNRVQAFLELGCRVVACEPQPECCALLRRIGAPPSLHIEECAVGATIGEATLERSSSHDVLATLSGDFTRRTQESGRFEERKACKKQDLRVKVRTLDSLISQYGAPRFVKIDVEGFETHVLKGLSSAVESLSFEYTPELYDDMSACVAHCESLGMTKFRLSFGESMRWSTRTNLTAKDVRGIFDALACDSVLFGDVYSFR